MQGGRESIKTHLTCLALFNIRNAMKTSLVFLIVSVLAGLLAVDAAVSFSPAIVVKEYGRNLWYCEYKGLEVLPRTRIIDRDGCVKCVCRRSGLDCATMVPVFSYPDDSKCMPITVRCRKVVWVLKKNPLRKCPDRLMPTQISAVGK